MIRYDSVIWSDGVSYSDCVIGTDGMRGSDCVIECVIWSEHGFSFD